MTYAGQEGRRPLSQETLNLQQKDAIIVGDRYQLVRRIGQGSFGEVFEGLDLISGVRVAVKLEDVH